MKMIYVAGMAVMLAACSTHRLRCRGALEPINEPMVPAKERKHGPAQEPSGGSPNEPEGGSTEGRP